MNIRTRSTWRAYAPAAIGLAVLAGLVPAPVHRSDNFNNNSLASFWGQGTNGNAAVDETNARLEFHNTGATGTFSAAGLGFEPYGINWKQDFHFEFNYRFKINSAAGTRKAFFGQVFSVAGDVPTTFTGVACGLLRDTGGLWLGVLEFSGGNIIDFSGMPLTQVSGKIEIDWDKSMDRFTVQRSNGGPSAHLDGYYAKNGGAWGTLPMETGLGIITYGGNMSFTGPNCYIDNWEGDFVKRSFTP